MIKTLFNKQDSLNKTINILWIVSFLFFVLGFYYSNSIIFKGTNFITSTFFISLYCISFYQIQKFKIKDRISFSDFQIVVISTTYQVLWLACLIMALSFDVNLSLGFENTYNIESKTYNTFFENKFNNFLSFFSAFNILFNYFIGLISCFLFFKEN
tara:strand:+ start:4301 stop:4768 length:468 start_codon:yes stop_codon:yes gene_type:complete